MKKKGKAGAGKKGQAALTKVVPVESFFNFFADRTPDSDADEGDEPGLAGEELQGDLEMMRVLIDICEHPLDWYTGRALEDEDGESEEDYSDEDEDDYSDEDEDEDSEDDSDDSGDKGRRPAAGKPAPKTGPKGGAKGGNKPDSSTDAQGNPQDCKQQ